MEPCIEGLEFYRDAFFELSTCRASSGPIPFTAISEYCRIFNIVNSPEELDEFIYVIRKMDDVYLKNEREKAKARGSTNVGKSNTSNKGTGRR